MSKTDKQVLGAWGEDQAVRFLTARGYHIVARNYLAKRGEIDIVAWHDKAHGGRTLCFVEVKTRSVGDDSQERATDWKKIQSLVFAGKMYCLEQDIDVDRVSIQFEQVSVTSEGPDLPAQCRHYEIPM